MTTTGAHSDISMTKTPSAELGHWQRWAAVWLGAVTGGLLFVSDYPVHAWWIQAVAFVPWMWGLARWTPGVGRGALSGVALGMAYTGALSLMLRFPILLAVALAGYLTAFWALFGAGAAWLLRRPERGLAGAVGTALGVACLGTLVEWLNVSVIPVWGTAQVFARVWSASPMAIQVTSATGILGLVWVLLATQVLAAIGISPTAGRRRQALIALGCLMGLVVAANALLWPRGRLGAVRVAAVGWTYENLPRGRHTPWRLTWARVLRPLLAEAAGKGAKLVVTPETGVFVPPDDVTEFRDRVGEEARTLGVFLAVGWFDQARNDNRILFVDAEGRVRGEYAKTHLIMTLEKYRPGDGTRVATSFGPYRLGGMICQDDNFTDLARGYANRGVHLMAVPTNDWREVRRYHLENSRFRAVDGRYAVVRAATNGTSAIVTARGEILGQADHFERGPAVVVAEVPLYAPGSIYARVGDGIVVVPCLLWLGALVGVRWWRARRERRAA